MNGHLTNDPPCSLNRDHGPIGCQATYQELVIPRREWKPDHFMSRTYHDGQIVSYKST